MGARDFQIFVVRYIDKPNGKFMNMAICMSEMSDSGSRFLACECTDKWENLEVLFPNADIDFLKDWCEAVQKAFCTPDTNRMAQERLKDCSSNVEVSVSRKTLKADEEPAEEMRKLVEAYLR